MNDSDIRCPFFVSILPRRHYYCSNTDIVLWVSVSLFVLFLEFKSTDVLGRVLFYSHVAIASLCITFMGPITPMWCRSVLWILLIRKIMTVHFMFIYARQ